jgi:peptide/nickel transport system substrate-binding protein
MTLSAVFLYISSLVMSFLPITGYSEGVIDQPRSFLPGVARSQHEKTVSALLYRGLFKYDIYGALVPDLADTWSVSEDGLVYTLKLKDNNYWNNGKKITSDDLIYTSFKHPDLAGVATDKVDALTVRYSLPNKYAPFLNLLTTGIMPVNAIENHQDIQPVSSGDFSVARIDRTGRLIRQVILITNKDNYKIKKLSFKYYSNEDELVTAGKLGEIQGFLAEKDHSLGNYENHKFPIQGIYYAIYFNTRDEKLKDVALRQKLEKVLPLDSIIYDRGISVEGPVSRSVYTDKDIKFDKYDSTFKDDLQNLKLSLTIPDTEKHEEIAKRIIDYWKTKLDVSIDLVKVKPSEFNAKVIDPRNFQILFYGQEIGRDPDRYVNWHSTQKDVPGLNLSGFDNVRADRALEEGRNELDNNKRMVHYTELQKVISENTPVVFLYHPFSNYYISKYINGIGEKYTFTYADRFLDFSNWDVVKTD